VKLEAGEKLDEKGKPVSFKGSFSYKGDAWWISCLIH
jgi:hypothetical protein